MAEAKPCAAFTGADQISRQQLLEAFERLCLGELRGVREECGVKRLAQHRRRVEHGSRPLGESVQLAADHAADPRGNTLAGRVLTGSAEPGPSGRGRRELLQVERVTTALAIQRLSQRRLQV